MNKWDAVDARIAKTWRQQPLALPLSRRTSLARRGVRLTSTHVRRPR